MKFNFLLLILIFPILLFSQDKETYQSDSIYKINKVKIRKWYTMKKLVATSYYDKEGRITKFKREPFTFGGQRTIYYEYDNNGNLVFKIDTTKNGKRDKKALKKLKKMGLNLSKGRKKKPKIEVSKFKIEYKDSVISKITEFNPNGTLKFIDYYTEKGKKQVKEWYRDGKIYRESTTEYIDDFHKEKYYGWKLQNGKKMKWNYTFKYTFENNKVKDFIRFEDGEQKETTTFTYNKKGLLTKMKYYTTENFEYEYFE